MCDRIIRTIEKILELYPELINEDIVAAIDYVIQVIDEENVIAGWKIAPLIPGRLAKIQYIRYYNCIL